jgi:prolyl-tRNA synthetase
MSDKKLLPSKQDNPSDWYTTIIRLADLADYGPAKGTMIIKPYGYSLWEAVQDAMNPQIKAKGVGNAYFPLFIPMSLIQKEASHVEGFAPELAVVTHGGGEELEEALVVRPTSETIMYNSYAKWIQSYRDLPMMMNQWNKAHHAVLTHQ